MEILTCFLFDFSGNETVGEVRYATDSSDLSKFGLAIAAGHMPNPSASTLGGMESLTIVTHNFLTSISTSGVQAAAQPVDVDNSFTDGTTGNVSISNYGYAF